MGNQETKESENKEWKETLQSLKKYDLSLEQIEVWKERFHEIDLNKDNHLDHQEFSNFLGIFGISPMLGKGLFSAFDLNGSKKKDK